MRGNHESAKMILRFITYDSDFFFTMFQHFSPFYRRLLYLLRKTEPELEILKLPPPQKKKKKKKKKYL